MTELKKLIELIKPYMSGLACGDESGACELTSCRDCRARNCANDLLANGVIVPPCKVGDTVYRIVEMGTGIHYKQVGRYEVGCTKGYKIVPCEEKKKRFIRSVAVTQNNFFDICENFGKTVFLTKEDAEKALKERSEGK